MFDGEGRRPRTYYAAEITHERAWDGLRVWTVLARIDGGPLWAAVFEQVPGAPPADVVQVAAVSERLVLEAVGGGDPARHERMRELGWIA